MLLTRSLPGIAPCGSRALGTSPLYTSRSRLPRFRSRRPCGPAAHSQDPNHAPSTPTFSSTDLDIGSDAFSGATLETPAQQAQHHNQLLHKEAQAREASQRREAHEVLAADESTAEEREDRYQGILQAIDSLSPQQPPPASAPPQQHSSSTYLSQSMAGASDDEDQRLSPEAASQAAGTSKEAQDSERFDALRQIVDRLGEGDEAARLIMESYEGRNLEQEAMRTMDPGDVDHMPHPGDRYLPPHAVMAHPPAHGAMSARLNHTHARPDLGQNRVLPLPPARGAGSGGEGQNVAPAAAAAASAQGDAWMPPEDRQPTAARAEHDLVGQESPVQGASVLASAATDDQAGQGGATGSAGGPSKPADDQIDYEQDALRGADALYYAPEHAANPSVNDRSSGGSGAASRGNIEAPDDFDVDRDAMRGADAMFYFKARGSREEREGRLQQGAVWGALHSVDEQHSAFRRAMEGGPSGAAKGSKRSVVPKRSGKAPQLLPQHVPALAAQQASSAASPQRGAAQHPEGLLLSLRKRQAERETSQATTSQANVQQLAEQPKGGRAGGRPPPEPQTGLLRLLDVAVGRAAVTGLASAFFSELLTNQSVMSQLLGRFEGPRQVELALPQSQSLAAAVLLGALVVTLAERVGGSSSPRWRPLGITPLAQVWLGRAAMALFVLLLAYESVHSNRPAFSTLFYLWF